MRATGASEFPSCMVFKSLRGAFTRQPTFSIFIAKRIGEYHSKFQITPNDGQPTVQPTNPTTVRSWKPGGQSAFTDSETNEEKTIPKIEFHSVADCTSRSSGVILIPSTRHNPGRQSLPVQLSITQLTEPPPISHARAYLRQGFAFEQSNTNHPFKTWPASKFATASGVPRVSW